jgi:glycosyltransferase involved in cell wall biosynthesis
MKTIDSILLQIYPPQEIIVVDDGSTDDMQQVKNHADPKVKYHRITNSGVCKARNIGVSLASSPYIAFCDSDDLWREDKLAKQMDLHDRLPDLRYSFTNFSLVLDGSWAKATKFGEAPQNFFTDCVQVGDTSLVSETPFYDRIIRFQPIFPSTILMKKSFYWELGGFDESFGRTPSEDLEFTLRCVQHAPIGIVVEPVVGIRKHSSNFSGDNYATARGRIEIFNYALTHHSVTEPIKSSLLDQITVNRVDASYTAFATRDFATCKNLLTGVPARFLTPKTRIKLAISQCPGPIAKLLHLFLAP